MRTVLFLLLPILASGQIYIDSYKFAAAQELLLDAYPSASGAYSLRLLDKDYTGDCIMVRRSNNDSSNIAFSNGYLDTVSLKSFCGTTSSDTCYVRVWYDQSGKAWNMDQTTSANQPYIVMGGVIDRQDGLPTITYTGNKFLQSRMASSTYVFLHDSISAFYGVGKFGNVEDPDAIYAFWATSTTIVPPGGAYLAHDTRASQSRDDQLLHIVGSNGAAVVNTNNTNESLANTQVLVVAYSDPKNATSANRSYLNSDGKTLRQNNSSTSATSNANPRHTLYFGMGLNSSNAQSIFLTGNMQELIFYKDATMIDLQNNRSGIESNINTFYSIY